MRGIFIFFCAGVSYGAGSILPKVSSLGNQLLEKLCKFFPRSWGSLPTEITSTFDNGFELAWL